MRKVEGLKREYLESPALFFVIFLLFFLKMLNNKSGHIQLERSLIVYVGCGMCKVEGLKREYLDDCRRHAVSRTILINTKLLEHLCPDSSRCKWPVLGQKLNSIPVLLF